MKKLIAILALTLAVVPAAEAFEIEAGADIHRKVQGKLEAIVAVVEYFGYRCDTVSAARPLIFGNGFSLYCNRFRYGYSIEDRGGNWTVTLD